MQGDQSYRIELFILFLDCVIQERICVFQREREKGNPFTHVSSVRPMTPELVGSRGTRCRDTPKSLLTRVKKVMKLDQSLMSQPCELFTSFDQALIVGYFSFLFFFFLLYAKVNQLTSQPTFNLVTIGCIFHSPQITCYCASAQFKVYKCNT